MTRESGPRISVVVTTYKRAGKLPATLDSILEQSLGDFELIISDDHSPDETPEVCAEYARRDPRVRFVRNDANLGMPGNLNAAIAQARGTYVANLHDDDIYRSDLLEKWAAALDRHPTAAFVFNAYEIVDARGRSRIDRVAMPECMPGRDFLRRIFVRQWGSPIFGTVMARKSCYDAVGPFDSRYSINSDIEMWVRLASRYDVAYVPEPLMTITPREPDHMLTGYYWWELTVDVRVRRSAVALLYPRSRWRRIWFELRARAHYGRNMLPALLFGRWAQLRTALSVILTGRDELAPPRPGSS